MANLVFSVSLDSSLNQIFQMISPYMKGLVYDNIYVVSEGKTKMNLARTNDGYKYNNTIITSDKIKKWYN